MTTNEKDLAEKLGISRAVLKGFRKEMAEGTDWAKVKGKIQYTEHGIALLEKELGLREVPDGFYFEDKEYKRVQVVRNWPFNKKILPCVDAMGKALMVRVRDNSNFRALLTTGDPMMLKVRKDGDGWTLEGRSPRYAGRW